jgi:hypothetical protein
MDPNRERTAALDAYRTLERRFKDRPFPHDWAKVVNGVGLVTLTERVEHYLGAFSFLNDRGLAYSYQAREARQVVADLRAVLPEFDRFLAALPAEPRSYFEDLRSLVSDALTFTNTWWAPLSAAEAAPRE